MLIPSTRGVAVTEQENAMVNGVPAEADVNVAIDRVCGSIVLETRIEAFRDATAKLQCRVTAAQSGKISMDAVAEVLYLLGHRRAVINESWQELDEQVTTLLKDVVANLVPRECVVAFLSEARKRAPKNSRLEESIKHLQWAH